MTRQNSLASRFQALMDLTKYGKPYTFRAKVNCREWIYFSIFGPPVVQIGRSIFDVG
jgi:hypothetical protein